ncbi:MAG: glycosyltransferase [Candidatus Cloacimonetes bacterium]|nr:glycosyltransferase [Candidatus Cloacimonadota bacterium]MBL7086017.1 glycosyltransferase [Candidatus Cloacimonadota bacterium]
MRKLEDYIGIVGDEVISNIYMNAKKIYGKHILHINSTYQGGGVSEMLVSLVPLMNNIGLDAGWRILHGSPDFFMITKKFHNGLQGAKINLSDLKKSLYTQTNENFSTFTHIDHDCVIIHDPQPLPLIRFYRKQQPWIWRCHIDLSDPQNDLWNFLKNFMLKYDVIISSSEKYKKANLPVEQRIICPAIDPISLKNKELSEKDILKFIKKARIPTDKPIITQVSRMDPWKDPEGLLEVFNLVKEKIDCRLVYCYNTAPDDPEGTTIYSRVYRKAKKLIEKGDVIFVVGNNDVLVNAVQRFSAVIVQKSIREGFCLAVTEALWKKKPVVASNVGGIPAQIKDGENGFLLEHTDIKGFADKIIRILQNPKLSTELGEKGKEFVRKKFLITRLLSDYLDLMNDVLN